MSELHLRSAGVLIATAVVAAVGLFLLLVSLAEQQHGSRLLFETALFLPLLLSTLTVARARRS